MSKHITLIAFLILGFIQMNSQAQERSFTPMGEVGVQDTCNAPVAIGDTVIVRKTIPDLYNILVNDYESYKCHLNKLEIISPPKGKIAIRRHEGVDKIMYQANYSGDEHDYFTYQICDDYGRCDEADVVIIKCPPNKPGFPSTMAQVIRKDTVVHFGFFGKLIRFSKQPLYGTIQMSIDSSMAIYRPNEGFLGRDRIDFAVYERFDYCGEMHDQSFHYDLIVIPPDKENKPPVAVADEVTVYGRNVAKIHPLKNDYDPDGSLDKRLIRVTTSKNGRVWYSPSTIQFAANQDYYGTETITYEVCDQNGACAEGTVTINVMKE